MGALGRGIIIIAVAIACAIGAAAGAHANVFAIDGQDPRAPTTRLGADRLYAPVGTIATRAPVSVSDDGSKTGYTRGSAFLVSPCYVLTNYHAVFGLAFDGPLADRDYSATFSVGADPDYLFRWSVKATPVRWGAFNRRKEHDWALLKLEGCVGGQPDVGWLSVAPEPGEAMLGSPVSLAGYPLDKDMKTLWVEPACRIEAMQAGTAKVLHGCSVRGGASGGPLISRAKGQPAVVAIQCGEQTPTASLLPAFDTQHANTAVTLAEVFQDAEARALVEADVAAFPGVNPALEAAAPPPAPPAAPTVTASLAPRPRLP